MRGGTYDTWEVHETVDSSLLESLGVADTRSLKDERGGKSASRHNNLLAGAERAPLNLAGVQGLDWDGLDANGSAVLHNDLLHLGAGGEIQVVVDSTC